MSLIESSYTVGQVSSKEEKLQLLNNSLKENIGLFEKDGIYYFDEKCSDVGICFTTGINANTGLTVTNYQKTIQKEYNCGITINSNKIYFHVGKNKESYYILLNESSSNISGLVAGKTDSGDWGIMLMDTVFFKENMFNMALDASISSTVLFTMVKMPALKQKENFTTVYKVLSAQSFDKHGTLIYDGEKIYRVVGINANASAPCVAFEVSED